MRLLWGTVAALRGGSEQAQQVLVRMDDGVERSAVCYPQLTGACAEGDRVLANTTAVDLDLGTGGELFVVARADAAGFEAPSPGHIMKLRYTPLQVDVLAVEAPESPHHHAMKLAYSLNAMPVVCCGLHSHVPLVAAAIKQCEPALRVAYCMTDHAALPAAFSRVLARSREAGLVDATVTCGQAFGGDFESVNLHSGLLASRHVAGADVAIVAIGPGVVGTATPFGHGGVAVGEAVNAVSALDGQPIVALRLSFADARERHRGVSHHTTSALMRVALAPALVAVPELAEDEAADVDRALEEAGVWDRHRKVLLPGKSADLRGVNVTTMGRTIDDDPAFFAAAFAAGEAAAAFAQRD